MSAPDWQLTSPLYAGNAAYLEQFGDDALAPWLAQPLPGATPASDATQVAVLRLINGYRYLGGGRAHLHPLPPLPPPPTPPRPRQPGGGGPAGAAAGGCGRCCSWGGGAPPPPGRHPAAA